MERTIQSAGMPIRAALFGEEAAKHGTLALLHGYLETLHVWDYFMPRLCEYYQIVMIDLPWHGCSGGIDHCGSMELMADALHGVCKFWRIKKVTPVGHSMGGYAALAFASKYADMTAGLCMFHSLPSADTEAKQQERSHVIESVLQGKRDAVIRSALQTLFAPHNLDSMMGYIYAMVGHCPSERGIAAVQRGMQQRADMTQFLREFAKPLMFIFGRHDLHISPHAAAQISHALPHAHTAWLENSGHCGMLEEPQQAAAMLREWLAAKNE
jgi:pimeloyl-ACP methyl ester carboxylesterase